MATKPQTTAKQEKFILNIINGMSQREAYKDAYDTKTSNMESVDKMASREFNKVDVRCRYLQLLEEQKDRFLMSSIEKRKILQDIIKTDTQLINKLKAIDLDNKMAGEYVTKIETTDDGFNVNISIGHEKKS